METLLLDRPHPGVLLITLNRPAKRNALNVQMVRELGSTLKEAETDDDVRCVVITGDQKAFSAGADIADQKTHGLSVVFSRERLEAWDVVQDFRKPKIAAVNGYALGGGCELVMLLDIVIAGENAIFGQPEINLGIFPGDGATQRLPRRIGLGNALRYILTGEHFGARRALELGLVCEVAPDDRTVERAVAIAAKIAEKSPIAVRLAREAVIEGLELPLRHGLLLERKNLALAFGSADQREGMAAFLEKRKPEFTGR